MAISTVEDLLEKGRAARTAARVYWQGCLPRSRIRALHNIADALDRDQARVLAANGRDYQGAKADGLSEAMLDRLLLTPERLRGYGRTTFAPWLLSPTRWAKHWTRPPGPMVLVVGRRRVPLGVVGSIYESRPNVTVDISATVPQVGQCLSAPGRKRKSPLQYRARVSLIRQAIGDAGDACRRCPVRRQPRPVAGGLAMLEHEGDTSISWCHGEEPA